MKTGERELLDLVRARLGASTKGFCMGDMQVDFPLTAADSDDCASIRFGDVELLLATDYVRGTGFRLFQAGLIDYTSIGRYLVAANLSDIAAMGARPIGFLSVVRYSPQMTEEEFTSVLDGINEAATASDVAILGGDIGGAETLVLSGTAIGIAAYGSVLRRHGMRPGDGVFVTGTIGRAAAALVYGLVLRDHWRPDAPMEDAILSAWRRPQARTVFGAALGAARVATASQDISDGLRGTLEDMLGDSLGVVLDETALPIDLSTRQVLKRYNGDPLVVLGGPSPDFELCFTAPAEFKSQIIEIGRQCDLQVSQIGVVTSSPEVVIRRKNGQITEFPGERWDQQDRKLESFFTSQDACSTAL